MDKMANNTNAKSNKKYQKGNGKVRNGKGKNKSDKFKDKDSLPLDMTQNDIQWYVKDEQLLKDTASIPFNRRLGQTLNVHDIFENMSENDGSVSVPGIARLNYIPSIGIIGNEGTVSDPAFKSSAINLAAKDMYARVRKVNSGSKNYEPVNLMVYMLALDNCYTFLHMLQRMYGVASQYNYTNSYYPVKVLQAMGVEYPHCIMTALPQIRSIINQFALKLSTFPVPKTFSLFDRHKYLSSRLFMDRDSTRAQLYIPVPQMLYKYTETDTDILKTLTPWQAGNEPGSDCWFTGGMSEDYIYNIKDACDKLIDPLLGSEAVGLIAGDIMKAYDSSEFIVPELIDENYVVSAEYDPVMLSQIHNCNIINVLPGDIKQKLDLESGTYLVQSASIPASVEDRAKKNLLNVHFNNPTPADVMYITRLHPVYDTVGDNTKLITGSEYVYSIIIYSADEEFRITSSYMNTYKDDATDITNYLSLSAFDWFPIIKFYYFSTNSGSTASSYHILFGDVDNYTVVDPGVISGIHEVALFGEFDVSYNSPLSVKK